MSVFWISASSALARAIGGLVMRLASFPAGAALAAWSAVSFGQPSTTEGTVMRYTAVWRWRPAAALLLLLAVATQQSSAAQPAMLIRQYATVYPAAGWAFSVGEFNRDEIGDLAAVGTAVSTFPGGGLGSWGPRQKALNASSRDRSRLATLGGGAAS
jgi:hypothetical protein